ncbi:MAG: hypothetical protein JNL43_10300 [Flavobacteriales bacterium]|nr:hypothetical protein [Flavobacteriales bacterium]HRH68420.1 hypothetical protein [Flavobacteriales bacterium]
MRTLILTAAAAVLFCATDVLAQGGTTTPVQTKPMSNPTPKPAPTSSLAEQKKNMTAELTKTLGSADDLFATATKMAQGSEGDRLNTIMRVADATKIVQTDLKNQIGLVEKATDKTISGVLNKAKEVNAASVRKLTSLKAELPKADTSTSTPADTKPTIPAQTK